MSSVAFVTGRIFARNGHVLNESSVEQAIPCEDVQVRGIAWWVPQYSGGFFDSYSRRITAEKPTPDSVKTIRLTLISRQEDIYVAINDSDETSAFISKCNGCCGDTPVMDEVIIPAFLQEQAVCPDIPSGTPNYTFFAIYPVNANSLDFLLSGVFNGQAGVPTPTAGGFANAAAVLAWVQANWDDYGTWSNVSLPGGRTQLKLVSETVKTGGISLGLEAATYCLEVPVTAATVDRIVIGGVTTTFTPTVLSRTSPAAVFNMLKGILSGSLEMKTFTDIPHYEYKGLNVPVKLQNGTTDVVSFTSGACS